MSGIEELALLAQRNNNQADGGSIVLGFIGLALIVGAIVLLAIRYPNYRASSDSDVWVVLAAVLLALFTLGYMLPSSIAIVRKVRNVGSIIVMDVDWLDRRAGDGSELKAAAAATTDECLRPTAPHRATPADTTDITTDTATDITTGIRSVRAKGNPAAAPGTPRRPVAHQNRLGSG